MEDMDEVVKEPVRTEGRLFIERGAFNITTIDILLSEGTELIITVMLGAEFGIGDVVVAAVAEEPHISLTSLLQDSLEGEGDRTAVLVFGPGIVTSCILNHLADGALAAWHIPDTASHLVEQHRGTVLL